MILITEHNALGMPYWPKTTLIWRKHIHTTGHYTKRGTVAIPRRKIVVLEGGFQLFAVVPSKGQFNTNQCLTNAINTRAQS